MTIGYMMLTIGCVGLAGTLIWIFVDAAKKPDNIPKDVAVQIIQDDAPIYTSKTSAGFNNGGGNVIPRSENVLDVNNGTELMHESNTSTGMMTKTSKFCPKCGTQNKTGGRFCQKCGNRL